MKFSDIDNTAISYAADVLGVKREWLVDLIQFESGWNPLAENKTTGARGLIQFMPSTAAAMGFSGTTSKSAGRPTAADKLVSVAPTIAEQMEYVIRYLTPQKPFPTLQSLHMAVFYPRYRSVATTTEFPTAVQKANPGIKTVADYMRRASPLARIVAPLVILSAGATIFF